MMVELDIDRFEHTHARLPIGSICHTEWRGERHAYIFGGWARNTAGLYPVFYRVHTGDWLPDGWLIHGIWAYVATYTATILKKFPDLPVECN